MGSQQPSMTEVSRGAHPPENSSRPGEAMYEISQYSSVDQYASVSTYPFVPPAGYHSRRTLEA